MSLFNTIHKRKSAVKTAVVMVLLVLSFFFVGMKYLDPPEEMGIEVNFGTSETGSGVVQPMDKIKSEPKPETPQEQEKIIEEIPEETTTETVEDVLTQETKEAPVISPKPKPKVQPKPKPKPDQSTSDALNSILNGPKNNGSTSQGEGDDTSGGDKGQIDGNPYANSYYGGGSGTGSGYGLRGRSKTSNQKFTQNCNEEGRVVVKIEVNKQGAVIRAVPGVKGSTNTAACLLEPARKTALSYRFNPDVKAPTKQIGFIVINFALGQ